MALPRRKEARSCKSETKSRSVQLLIVYIFQSLTIMAKKNKDEAPNANNIVNKDIMQRLNFMYQASVYLSGVLPIVPPQSSVAPRRRQKKSRKMTVHDLSKSYINSMKIVANKTMVKMYSVPSQPTPF